MKRLSGRDSRRQLPRVRYWETPSQAREIGRSANVPGSARVADDAAIQQGMDQVLRELLMPRPGERFGESNKPRYGVLVLNSGEELLGFWSILPNGSYEGHRSSRGTQAAFSDEQLQRENAVWLENFPACQVFRLALIKPTVEEA